ncbi:hypothetical protein RhiJN_26406 [Ceratobasidium sp. AG-Ba]|nr:hypothetical protein RhiJN_26406 [Ceratobasidium sp. AG-Ba]
MYLQPLVLASVFKTILFTVLSLDDFSSYLTIAAADVSLRAAHLATYVGLSRSGLQLPVGSFLPPPRPVTSTDIALYITPVAAASWRPTVDAFNMLLAAVPDVAVTIESPIVSRTRHALVRTYERYARLLVHTQPVWSLTNRQPNSIGYSYGNQTCDYDCAQEYFPLFLSARTHLPNQPPPFSNWSTSVAPSPSTDLQDLYSLVSYTYGTHIQIPSSVLPFEPSSAGYRAPTSAAVSLGQCTPYCVLPAQVEITLATDVLGESRPEIEHYAQILDQLEPEVSPKELVVYEYPPCTPGSCELVVFVKPSELVVEECFLVCAAAFWYCAAFIDVWIRLVAYQLVRWVYGILLVVLVFVCASVMSLFKKLMTFMMGVCGRSFVDTLTSTHDEVQDADSASPIDNLILSTESIDPTPVVDGALDPTPTLVIPSDHDVAAESAHNERVRHEKRSNKTVRFEPASIPLPKDNEPWETEPVSEPEPEPAAPPPVPTASLEPSNDKPAPSATVDAAGDLPLSQDKGVSVEPSSDHHAPSRDHRTSPGARKLELGGDGKEREKEGYRRKAVKENWDRREGAAGRTTSTRRLTHPDDVPNPIRARYKVAQLRK